MEKIRIGNSLEVELYVDNYGKCVRLYQNRCSISLGSVAWSKLVQHGAGLTIRNMLNMRDRSQHTVSLTSRKFVRSAIHKEKRYITFTERPRYEDPLNPDRPLPKRPFVKEIKLTMRDWELFSIHFFRISNLMDEATIVYSTSDGEWHLLHGAAALEGQPGKMLRQLRPRLCNKQITTRLHAYLIRKAVVNKGEDVCGWHESTPVEDLWRQAAAEQFDALKETVDKDAALKALNEAMKWCIVNCRQADDELLRNLVQDQHLDIPCTCCRDKAKDLSEMYERLFSYLLL